MLTPAGAYRLSGAGVALTAAAASAAAGAAAAAAPPRTAAAVVAGLVLAASTAVARRRGAVWLAGLRWWHGLWLLLFLSGLVLRIRSTSAVREDAVDAAALYRVALVAAVGCALLALTALRRVDAGAIGRGLFLPLLAFSAVNLLSTAWSVQPGWTFYRSAEFAVDTALVAIVGARLATAAEWRRLFDWAWLLVGGLLVTVGLGVVLVPERALVRGLGTLGVGVQGVFPHLARNGVGHAAALLFVVAVARLATRSGRPGRHLALLLAAAPVLVLSQTRSALVPALVAVPVVLVAARRVTWTVALPVAVCVALAATGFGSMFSGFLVRGQSPEQLADLSSRTEYWSYGWELLQERPLTGYGAYAGGRFEVTASFAEELSSTHGTFPEIAVGTSVWGVVPVALLLAAVWLVLLRAVAVRPSPGTDERLRWALAVEALAVLTVLSGRSFFTVTLIWHPALEFLLVVAYAESLRRRRGERAR